MTPNFLADSPDRFPGFSPRTEISTIFLENRGHLLLLKRAHREDQPETWGVPGGKREGSESPQETLHRELEEETGIKLPREQASYLGKRWARIPGWDYIVHIFYSKLKERPEVSLNSEEHSAYRWTSVYAFKLLPLLKGQDEVFDCVFGSKIWQAAKKSSDSAALVFSKGDKRLSFSAEKRLVFNLIGNSGSGKGTQGELLSKIYGLPHLSAGDLFRDEFRARSSLGAVVQDYDKKHYPNYLPDEIPIGMMAKRLAKKDCSFGFILDGFPRTKGQAQTTTRLFLRTLDLHIPLLMDVEEEELRKRFAGRSICLTCGHQERSFDQSSRPGFCPKDGSQLEKRVEDVEEEKIARRFQMFRDNRSGVLSTLEKRDAVRQFSLDNSTPPEEVFHLLSKEIQSRLDAEAEKREV